MRKKLRWILRGVFVLILICSVFIIYNWYHDYFKSVPSEKWAKEVKIAVGNNIDKSTISKYVDKNVIVYSEKGNVNIILTDKLGKILKNKVIKTEDEFVKDSNSFTDEKNIYVSWIKSKSGETYMETYMFDENLNELKKTKDTGVQSCRAISSEDMLLTYKNKIEIRNLKENKSIDLNLVSSLANAVKTSGGYIVGSLDYDKFSCIAIKDWQVKENKQIAKFTINPRMTISDVAVNSDGKQMYALFETSDKGAYGRMIKLIYNITTGEVVDRQDLQLEDKENFYKPIAVSSKDRNEFLVVSEKKSHVEQNSETQVFDLVFKDKIPQRLTTVTRTLGFSSAPSISEDAVVFLNVNRGKQTIYMTSNSDEFKKANNINREEEVQLSKEYTISRSIVAVGDGLLIGLKWIGAGVILMAIMCIFLLDRYQDKYKKPFYIISYLLVAIIKTYTIYHGEYIRIHSNFPKILSNPTIGVCFLISISILCGFYAYLKYSKDLEQIAFASFMEGLIIDTILTSILFIPYI